MRISAFWLLVAGFAALRIRYFTEFSSLIGNMARALLFISFNRRSNASETSMCSCFVRVMIFTTCRPWPICNRPRLAAV